MNPETSIRPWILAAGKQYGIRYCKEYRWHDADNKPDEPYVTYQVAGSVPESHAIMDLTTASGNSAVERAAQPWLTTIVIDLYNDQDGVYNLASMIVALKHHTSLRSLFADHAALYQHTPVDDMTEFDDEEINYHHRITCVFRENVEHSLTETDGVVDAIEIKLGDDYPKYRITDDGYLQALTMTVTSGDLVATGTATLTVA